MTSEKVRKGTTRGLIDIDYLLAIMVQNAVSSILIPIGTGGGKLTYLYQPTFVFARSVELEAFNNRS